MAPENDNGGTSGKARMPIPGSPPSDEHQTTPAVRDLRPGNLERDSQFQEPDVEVLGRARPPAFKTRWAELGFCFALLASMFMAEFFVSGFHIILPPIAEALEIPNSSQTWPSSVFSLVTGACLLPGGRLGDMYGGYIVFNVGLVWFFIWSLVAGFSQNYVMLVCFRALQGLGCAAILPAGIMLLGKTYRPGPRKNLVFGIYGAFAPIGFFFGILVGGAAGQYLTWRWYFWLGSIVIGVIAVPSFLVIPRDYHSPNPGKTRMDWWGAGTIVPGLVLVVFALTDSSSAPNGWASPQIIAPLIIGVLFLCAAIYVQNRVSSDPLLPAALFAPKYMKAMVLALFLAYGAFGIFLFYSSFYIELVMDQPPLTTAVWYIPMVVGGLIIGTVGGATLHRLPGRLLFILSGLGHIICALLFAIMPEGVGFWPYVFPAMIASTIGIDITYTVSNIFITTNLPAHYQGLAGAVINSVLFLGISFFLGIADIGVGATQDRGLRGSYQVAFWLALGLSGGATVIFAFMKIGYAKSDLTMEERAQMEEDAGEDRRPADSEELDTGTSSGSQGEEDMSEMPGSSLDNYWERSGR